MLSDVVFLPEVGWNECLRMLLCFCFAESAILLRTPISTMLCERATPLSPIFLLTGWANNPMLEGTALPAPRHDYEWLKP